MTTLDSRLHGDDGFWYKKAITIRNLRFLLANLKLELSSLNKQVNFFIQP